MATPNPVWFITAASSGFGHEIALVAIKRGHKVIATARNPTKLQDLQSLGADALAFDVTAPLSAMESVAASVGQKYGRVDYLVNTAGYIFESAVEEATPEEVLQQFSTNVFGVVNTIRAFLPLLRTQPLPPSGIRATIATFGSLGSWEGGATYAFYAMTKSCASSLAESLREELAPFDIGATVIEPEYFRTNFLKPGAKVSATNRMVEYEDDATPTGKIRAALRQTDGNQPGDVKKGAEACVDVLTGSGVAQGRALPPRLVIGSDCESVIRAKCASVIELLDEWAPIARSTDFPKLGLK